MFTWYAAVTWGMTELAGADQQPIRMPASAEGAERKMCDRKF